MLLKMNLPLKKLYHLPSIQKIKSAFNTDTKFDLPKATAIDINKIIQPLDTNKATGPDGIPAKFVQMSVNVIDCHLSNIIICDISKNNYSEHAKTATVRTTISLLNVFSKLYERYVHENLTNYVNTFSSKFIFAYRKSYRTNHVLIRLI